MGCGRSDKTITSRQELDITDSFLCIERFQRAKPIIIDPGLYMDKKTDIFWATQRRAVPSAFRLFTGTVILSNV
jgi:hypothetical protein